MNKKIISLLATIFAACSMLAACSSGGSTTDSSASKPAASALLASATSSSAPSVNAPSSSGPSAGKPSAAALSASASTKPSASAQSTATVSPKATPSDNPSGSSAAVDPDAALKKLLIGTWATTEGGTMKFDQGGKLTVTSPDKTVTTGTYSIKGLEETSMTITVKDADGTSDSVNAYFTDNNTLVIGEAVLTRIFENEMVNSEAALKKLLIGTWETPEGGTMKFDKNGKFTITSPDHTILTGSYNIKGLEETSMTITLIDPDGSSSSENAAFTDNNTMVIGEAVLTRVS